MTFVRLGTISENKCSTNKLAMDGCALLYHMLVEITSGSISGEFVKMYNPPHGSIIVRYHIMVISD